jgi:hypothetical protein
MRRIKVGDTVRAHLDGSYRGQVLEIVAEKSQVWMMEGTSTDVMYCVIKLHTGQVVKTQMSDLCVVDE